MARTMTGLYLQTHRSIFVGLKGKETFECAERKDDSWKETYGALDGQGGRDK